MKLAFASVEPRLLAAESPWTAGLACAVRLMIGPKTLLAAMSQLVPFPELQDARFQNQIPIVSPLRTRPKTFLSRILTSRPCGYVVGHAAPGPRSLVADQISGSHLGARESIPRAPDAIPPEPCKNRFFSHTQAGNGLTRGGGSAGIGGWWGL